jgi:hypothetical protein
MHNGGTSGVCVGSVVPTEPSYKFEEEEEAKKRCKKEEEKTAPCR